MIRKGLLLSTAGLLLAAAAYAFPPIDLTFPGTTVTSTVDGTIWVNLKAPDGTAVQPAGTGVYDPFLREQANGSGPNGDNGIEYGINTDGTVSEPYDNVGNDPHTHSLLFGDLQKVTRDGEDYYLFSLDMNEPSGGDQNFLSLDRIKIYTVDNSAGGSLISEAEVIAAAGSTKNYDMDDFNLNGVVEAGEDQVVYLDYNQSNTGMKDQGSGEDDMNLYIPAAFFDAAQATDYFYFLADFGAAGALQDPDNPNKDVTFYGQDGFEEWRAHVAPVPQPGTLALFGIGLAGLIAARRKK